MKIIRFFLLFLTGALSLCAQSPSQLTSSEIQKALNKLNTLGSVLYIAAHPDDENTRLLTYLSKEKNVRTAYLSLTRGDGGQNLIGNEQGEALGVIRTQELLAARRIDGAEQFFTRANDFGFSKNPEETFAFWNKDSVLKDVVWVIRKFKPDVIICRFPTTGEGGHGHHTASALLAVEAFSAAADPAKFPDQLKFVEPWQATRISWNTFNFGGTNTTSPDQLKIDVGGYDPLLGKSYGEIAAESRSMHKSQGFGSAKTRGTTLEYFKHLEGKPPKDDLFESIDVSWKRVAGAGNIEKSVAALNKKFNLQSPSEILPDLISLYNQIKTLEENKSENSFWKKVKLKEVESLILNCSGLWLESTANDFMGIPGTPLTITTQVILRNKGNVKLNSIKWIGRSDTLTSLPLKHNELYTFKHKDTLPGTLTFSNPYWLNEPHQAGLYNVKDRQMVGIPQNHSNTTVKYDLEINGQKFSIDLPLVYKSTDPVKGEVYRPYEILPPVTIAFSEKVFFFPDEKIKRVILTVKTNANNLKGLVKLVLPEGWKSSITEKEFSLAAKGEEFTIEAEITPAGNNSSGKLKAQINIDGKEYSNSIRRIEYDHIPYQFILSEAEVKLVRGDVKIEGKNIGYIPGAGDEVPQSLKQMGYEVSILTEDLLKILDLSRFDAIVTGVRAHNTNNWMNAHYNKLMDYVKNGGNLIVQYNTNNRIGPLTAKIGPYPFTISRERVTDENAEVRFVKPDHAVLNSPNKITQEDFKGWVQERGIYFATELDKNYETVLSMNDPNEKAHEGSLIIAKHGKGNFIYTGLAFFRELPAGVPGAYRLFANILSLPKNK